MSYLQLGSSPLLCTQRTLRRGQRLCWVDGRGAGGHRPTRAEGGCRAGGSRITVSRPGGSRTNGHRALHVHGTAEITKPQPVRAPCLLSVGRRRRGGLNREGEVLYNSCRQSAVKRMHLVPGRVALISCSSAEPLAGWSRGR